MEKSAQRITPKIVPMTIYYEGNHKQNIEVSQTLLAETWKYDKDNN